MKFLILLTVVAFVAADKSALSEEKLAKLNEIKDLCLPETGAAPDILDKFFAGDFSNKDRASKCFAKCFYQKLGFFDKDDNLDAKITIDSLTKDFGAENADKWVTPCKDIKQEDACDRAFETFECFHKHKHLKE